MGISEMTAEYEKLDKLVSHERKTAIQTLIEYVIMECVVKHTDSDKIRDEAYKYIDTIFEKEDDNE